MSRQRPSSHDQHLFFFDFRDFGQRQNPIWFAMIRDPIEKFASRFNFYRDIVCKKRIRDKVRLATGKIVNKLGNYFIPRS